MTVVRRTSTAEAIEQHIIGRIRTGEFGPGDRLPSECRLQSQLGVGRLSLREALARLRALGIIRVDHGKGAFVQKRINCDTIINALVPFFPERDIKALEDLVNARGLIEGELAAQAAAKRTDNDVKRLKSILNNSEDAFKNERLLAELDYKFHCEVAKIADNHFLTVMLQALRNHIRSFLLHYVRACDDPKSVIDRHKPILQAIIDRDPEIAREAAHKHVNMCKSSLEAYMEARKTQP